MFHMNSISLQKCIHKVELFDTRVEEEGVNLSENVSICLSEKT